MVAALLAEFGAEVIKVEHGARLDNMRLRGHPNLDGRQPEGPAIECNPYFNQINHDKGSITVNLKDPRGQALLQRLIPLTDVVIENLTPGALPMSRLDGGQIILVTPRNRHRRKPRLYVESDVTLDLCLSQFTDNKVRHFFKGFSNGNVLD